MLHMPKKALLLASKRVLRPQDYFRANLRTGNGGTQVVNGLIRPDLLWIKSRPTTQSIPMFDTEQGAGYFTYSDTTAQPNFQSTTLNSFDASGYTLGNNAIVNVSGRTYVDYLFKKYAGFYHQLIVNKPSGQTSVAVDLSILGTVGMVFVRDISGNAGRNLVGWNIGLPGANFINNGTAGTAVPANSQASPGLSVSGTTLTINPGSTVASSYICYAFAHQPNGMIQCGATSVTANVTTNVDLGWNIQSLFTRSSSGSATGVRDIVRNLDSAGGTALDLSTTITEGSKSTIYKTINNGFSITQTGAGTVLWMAIRAAA